ncbi:MAG: RNA 2',3'-cyclic phosphodiesterase [Sphingomonadales bacterium]
MRLFVGIALPDAIRQQALMLAGGIRGARWLRDDQLHITVRFLGEVDGRTAGDVDDALAAMTAPPFTMSLGGVGLFGTLRQPRILWAGVEPVDRICHLQAKVERAVQGAGVAPDGRKFSPHVTLARFGPGRDRRKSAAGLDRFIHNHSTFSTPAFDVDALILYSSLLSETGAIYRPEARYPLI